LAGNGVNKTRRNKKNPACGVFFVASCLVDSVAGQAKVTVGRANLLFLGRVFPSVIMQKNVAHSLHLHLHLHFLRSSQESNHWRAKRTSRAAWLRVGEPEESIAVRLI